jgi:hypothetical protein
MPDTKRLNTLQITITRYTFQEAYEAITENESRGYEQVGNLGTFQDMNGNTRYVVTMRKVVGE